MKVGVLAKAITCALAAGFPLIAFAGPAGDIDSDGVVDVVDNCTFVANAGTAGCDADIDGYGNACDCDLDNNGSCSGSDGAILGNALFTTGVPGVPPVEDTNCDGVMSGLDGALFGAALFGTGPGGLGPGPSGLSCAGTIPCK